MTNSDYMYLQVINGTGSYQLEIPVVYVDGVRELQHRLLMIGYPPPTEFGKFKQGTKDAILAFQKESQLLVDGIVVVCEPIAKTPIRGNSKCADGVDPF